MRCITAVKHYTLLDFKYLCVDSLEIMEEKCRGKQKTVRLRTLAVHTLVLKVSYFVAAQKINNVTT